MAAGQRRSRALQPHGRRGYRRNLTVAGLAWIWHPEGKLDDGRKVTTDMNHTMIPEELEVIRKEYGAAYHKDSTLQATKLFESLVTSDTFEKFLTPQAYDLIE